MFRVPNLLFYIYIYYGHHVEHRHYNIQSCWCCWLLGYQVMGHHVAHEDVQGAVKLGCNGVLMEF